MNALIDLDGVRQRNALAAWSANCRRAFGRRFPKIDFENDIWPIETLYASRVRDISLQAPLQDFEVKDSSFNDALRCIAATIAVADRLKDPRPELRAFRLLSDVQAETIFDLSIPDLMSLEANLLIKAKAAPETAQTARHLLRRLGRHLETLSSKSIISRIKYKPSREVQAALATLQRAHRSWLKDKASKTLDNKIESLSESITSAFRQDPILSVTDISTISLMAMEMSAPSRINEILCLSVDDRVSLDDYVKRSDGKSSDQTHSAHQTLIVTMKGSKGAAWGAKPILNFMIGLFNLSIETIINNGKRSRKLVNWYEKNPQKLFLPPDLEYLRGGQISVNDLWRIMNFADSPKTDRRPRSSNVTVFRELKSKLLFLPNPRLGEPGQKKLLPVLRWDDLEPHLLKRVHSAMEDCRRVTTHNHYKGTLSRMLFLLDVEDTPYLPSSLKYATVARRLKSHTSDVEFYDRHRRARLEPTIFQKLNIVMPIDGKVGFAEIETHDPRRWLNTQALLHREKLSDALINKWARRLDIRQLDSYDLRTPEQKADKSAMPTVVELTDLSAGLEAIHRAEENYGLNSELVVVDEARITMTSMESIAQAVETRPVARTSEQLFVIYPNWYGACIHQHHEKPCTAYLSCLPCDNNLVVKGHLPTNEEVRKRSHVLYQSIVDQIEKLVFAHNRSIADNPGDLAEHVFTLASKGLSATGMADDLTERFHEIRHLIKEVAFFNKLEEAFVARKMVHHLDSPNVASGALIKYHNPTRHASPGMERAMEANGTRSEVGTRRESLIKLYPEFAPTSIGLLDQRALLTEEDDDSEEEDSQMKGADLAGEVNNDVQ
ncbi:hypothetical protein [Roseateles sp.]|uniref:hypothetical protein n=1 Tax=Roseateles sp. TaxID=1971397 RepID=UPI003D0F2C3D